MTAYDPHFLCQNLIILSKKGCLQKTRPKNIHFWTNDKQFCMIKNISVEPQNFLKISYLAQFWKFLLNSICGRFWGTITRLVGPLVSVDESVVGAWMVSNDIRKYGWKFELSKTLFFALVVHYPDIFQILNNLYSLDHIWLN